MKISIPANEMLSRVEQCAKLIAVRTTLPIIGCVRLSVTAEGYELETSNLDQWLSCKVMYDHKGAFEAGQYCVAAKMFASSLASYGKSVVNIVCDGKKIVISEGRNKFELHVLPVAEWPACPGEDLPEAIKIASPDTWVSDLLWVAKAASSEPSRYILNGVNVRPRDGVIAASDGRRAHKVSIPKSEHDDFVLPTAAVALVAAIATKSKDAKIYADSHMMRVAGGEWVLTSKVIEGMWPWASAGTFFKWDGVRPELKASRTELESALKAAAPFGGEYTTVTISAEPMGILVEAFSPDRGKVERWVTGSGDTPKFAGNASQLADLIQGTGDEVIFRMMDEISPTQYLSGNRHGVVMPIRINTPKA